MAANTLNLSVYSNIPYLIFYPTTATIDQERAFVASATASSTAQVTAAPTGFGYNLPGRTAALYTGYLNVAQAGNYMFAATADDAARISLNGTAIVEATFYNGGVKLPSQKSLYLEAGSYAYEAFTFQTVGGSYFTTSVTGGPAAVSFSAAAVPEPATWAMMLVGFALVAGASRYRRRATSIVFG